MIPEDVEILDTTLRDGSYVIDFQFTAEDTALIASALESAGIGLIEVAHGLGLGAARAGKGDQASTDEAYLQAAASVLKKARFGTFFIPGIGTEDDLRLGADCGMHFVRVGTNVTEVHEAEPYVRLAKKLGLIVSCNLMKSYAVTAEEFTRCAQTAESFGADIVCIVDSAGCMLPEDVRRYVETTRETCSLSIGFHGHDNLCMGTASAIEAGEAGARVLDTSLQGLGRSEGNVMTEVLVAILQKRGLLEHMDVNALLDISEAFIRPLIRSSGRSGMGITFGRAKFHSSFLGRVLKAAGQFGVDPRNLILSLGECDLVNPSEELMAKLAADLAKKGGRAPIRVGIAAAATAEAPDEFMAQLTTRTQELREKACKLGLKSVLNVVVSPYEATHVSPFVETGYGCALSNVMLAEAALVNGVLETADGLVDYVLLDPGEAAIPSDILKRSVLLPYSDHLMWARATVTHLGMLLVNGLHGKKVIVTGTPRLAGHAAFACAEEGAEVYLDSFLSEQAQALTLLAPTTIEVRSLWDAAPTADAVVSLSPRSPAVTSDIVGRMRKDTLLYDGGIGSLEPDAVAAAEQHGVRVVRVDLRPTLAATALELMGMKRIVENHMGRDSWNGVNVVAGGLIGHEGDVIVDSISWPTRVIGIADGGGGILQPDSADPDVQVVRRCIAERQLQGP